MLDWFCGRTFDHVDSDATFTVTSFTANGLAICHVSDGSTHKIPIDVLREALGQGSIVESLVAPFINRRGGSTLRRYVAGPNKRPMRLER